MRDLTPADLAFFETAPKKIVTSVHIAAPPDRVFATFSSPIEWFPLMYKLQWVKGRDAVGAERDVALRGLGKFRERILAFDPGVRFAFTMTQSSSPLANMLAEDYRLSREGDGTRFDWVFAADPTTFGKLAWLPTRALMTRLCARAARNIAKLAGAERAA